MAETEKATDEKPKRTTRKAKDSGVRGEFPFKKDNYLSTPSTSRRGHHAGNEVSMVQEQLGVKVTGEFDDKTRDALLDYQRDNDLTVSGVVDAETWDHMKEA